eukprot:TRINITY_DN16399_c0_g1_i1.p1 TRINITY_DN16399_c0_g1~~TRINITY_DN16399_c0_g1_i1.p1  ORF type:complete len:213 (+),score=21.09 TRINITY_DN16399_c0_g1_i1:193-831(+)
MCTLVISGSRYSTVLVHHVVERRIISQRKMVRATHCFLLVPFWACAAVPVTLAGNVWQSFLRQSTNGASPQKTIDRQAGFNVEAVSATPVAASSSKVEVGVQSPVCDAIESSLQRIVEVFCNTSKPIACVYGNTQCSHEQLCSGSTDCGYIEDNDFVKFDSYSCEITDASKLSGAVTCHPVLQPVTWALLAVGAVVFLCGCCCLIRCCCFRG